MNAPRIARPPIGKKDRMVPLLSVRLEKDERRLLERAPESSGAGLSELARSVLATS